MNVLITGGAGFIGQNLCRSLLKSGHSVRILDNFSEQVHLEKRLPSDLEQDVNLIQGDIRDPEAVHRSLLDVETVVHLAAETGTGQSMYEIQKYFDVNCQGTALLLDIILNQKPCPNLRSIIVASSRAIYGEGCYKCKIHGDVYPHTRTFSMLNLGQFDPVCPLCNCSVDVVPTTESAPFMPASVYGLTKQVQEQMVLMFSKSIGVNAFALRYQNVYGPGQSLKNPYTGILAVYSNLAIHGLDLEVYEDGLESRDFVYVDDVVEATERAVLYNGEFTSSLNVGSGCPVNVKTIAENVVNYFNSSSKIEVNGKFRLGDIRHNIADTTRLEEILKFKPKTSFNNGLNKFLHWAEGQSAQNPASYQNSVLELQSKGFMGCVKSR